MKYIIIGIIIIIVLGLGYAKLKSLFAGILAFIKENAPTFIISAIIFIAIVVIVVKVFLALLPVVIVIGIAALIISSFKQPKQ